VRKIKGIWGKRKEDLGKGVENKDMAV